MQFKKILRLIQIVEKSQINELKISGWGQYIRITKDAPQSELFTKFSGVPQIAPWEDGSSTFPRVSSKAQEPTPTPTQMKEDSNWVDIRSPMMGIFYRASAPDQPPYVEVGDLIAPGQAICLIEAMKLMNEIQAEVGGRVAEVFVENGQAVEHNQVLFRLHKQ